MHAGFAASRAAFFKHVCSHVTKQHCRSEEGNASPAAASLMVSAAASLSVAAVFASASALTCANGEDKSDGWPAACSNEMWSAKCCKRHHVTEMIREA